VDETKVTVVENQGQITDSLTFYKIGKRWQN